MFSIGLGLIETESSGNCTISQETQTLTNHRTFLRTEESATERTSCATSGLRS